MFVRVKKSGAYQYLQIVHILHAATF
jgi:hypothetical protein